MPNQRSKKKAPLTGYFPREKVEAFKARADEMGLTAKDLIELLIDQELTRTNGFVTNVERLPPGPVPTLRGKVERRK